MAELPTGTVTFLFTDIEGSTPLAQQFPAELPALLARHHTILHAAIAAHHGHVFQIIGDAFCAAFYTASDALQAALDAQRTLQYEAWLPAPIRVRMGLHTGSAQASAAEAVAGGYVGYATLARTQRVMSVAYGDQILLSNACAELLRGQLPVDITLRDMGDHRLKGLAQPDRLWQLVAPGLATEFPPLKSLTTVPNNLPIQLTSFVGREKEISEAIRLMTNTRIFTFIGPGGTGKTRLALQLAEEQLTEFKDGAWQVELAPLADAAYITSTIAATFSLREVQGVPLINSVIDYLRGKQLLLILDNCEHLVEACAQLADQLLHDCPHLKIIASSREALGISGETVYRVPSLLDSEAARLFIERAVKADARFKATEQYTPFIVQICHRLDGIPLAIELAAARVKLFTPQQIAERLDDRFKLLTGGSRTALPRQQTLRALIDWSYLTLNGMEQRALRRLAVFSGGWTIEAAEAIIGEPETLDGLAGLVNKSLVNVEEQDGASRYQFLETIRQYAMEKLVEANEAGETRDRHLKYFKDLALQNNRTISIFAAAIAVDEEARTYAWARAIDKEYDNMRAALEWAIQSDPAAAAELIDILNPYWNVRDLNSEARLWCRAIIDNPRITDAPRSKALGILAYALMILGEMREAATAASQGIEISRRIGDKQTLARSLSSLAMASVFTSGPEAAMKAAQESEAIAREAQFREGIAASLGMKASVLLLSGGDLMEARRNIEESMVVAKETGFVWGTALSGMGLGRLASRMGDLEGARQEFARAAETAQRVGNRRIYASCRSELAHALRQHGKFDEAIGLYKMVLPIWQDFGHRAAVAHELECLGYIANAQDDGYRAARLLGAAEAIRKTINSTTNGVELVEYEREIAALRASMDENEMQAAWAEGRAMTIDQAIEYALEKSDG
jgi:predicted ATPase/class 3 adenylate cyclase